METVRVSSNRSTTFIEEEIIGNSYKKKMLSDSDIESSVAVNPFVIAHVLLTFECGIAYLTMIRFCLAVRLFMLF